MNRNYFLCGFFAQPPSATAALVRTHHFMSGAFKEIKIFHQESSTL